MHYSKVWIGLLVVFVSGFTWYSVMTLHHLYVYWRLSGESTPIEIAWYVKEVKEDTFAAAANYRFQKGDQIIEGSDYLKKPLYHNKWAAEEAIARNAPSHHLIWYRPSDPAYSALTKAFPTKELIYTLILFGLMIYFIGLRQRSYRF